MRTDFKRRATDIFWSYRWTEGVRPVVFFGNPKVSTNVIYTVDELRSILQRSDLEISFIPVPREYMQSALDAFDDSLALAA